MRKILSFAVVLVLFSALTVQAEPLKIVQCDLQKVATGTVAFKEAQTTATKALTPARQRLEKERKSIEAEVIALGAKPPKDKATALSKRQSDYMAETTAYFENIQRSEMQLRQEMDKLILLAAESYSKKNGHALLLDSNAILYKEGSLTISDVTADMIKEADSVWKASKKR